MLVKSEFGVVQTIIRRPDILLLIVKDVKLTIEVEVKAQHLRDKLNLRAGDKVYIEGHLRSSKTNQHKVIATKVEKID